MDEVFAIIRVYKPNFRTSKDNLNRLYACNRISAQIWNKCLELAKEHYTKTGEWIDRKAFHYATKGQYPIHSQSIQAVYERYLDARENAQKARAFSQPSMGMLSWFIRYSAISKGFVDLLVRKYSLIVSKRPFP